ncbi:MAG: cupin domain-containing protein [Christensenella sp.]|uniref:cupin domain-containing protein n=1 Tax=Christensenella sp. TaxID=1935934 RepID=UPI002B2206DA|nr:cupin domain-containing protein [Christensenella sp.]MEA5003477.1 cupin domain-containing protein [Christensenella sp.]
MRGVIKSEREAQTSLEGEELCRLYYQTEKITFGVSKLKPGTTGDLDSGHKDADEVFYCMRGNVLCYFPEDDHYYELREGDALLIPPETGHKLFNIGDEEAVISWSCAPKP